MKVRLTSGNIHKNRNFELWDGTNPVGWFSSASLKNDDVWRINVTDQLYSGTTLNLQDNVANALEYLDVVKGATVKAVSSTGTYNNVSTIDHDLTINYVKHEDVTTALDLGTIGLDRLYTQFGGSDTMDIKDITTFLTMETEMLRFPEYTDQKDFGVLFVQEKNSKRVEITQKYNPANTTLSFLNCLEENEAIRTFFYTCAVYGAGFSVEIWEEQTTGGNWGNIKWSTPKWGGFDSGFGYSKKYYFDIANNSFTEGNTTGKLDINVILQKRELDYGNN